MKNMKQGLGQALLGWCLVGACALARATESVPVPVRQEGSVPMALFAPTRVEAHLAKTAGLVVVQLTSFETTCSFCIRGNPTYDALAKDSATEAQFIRVIYRPWTGVAQDPFAKALGVGGLPVFLTYQDGKLLRRHDGIGTQAELQKDLLGGLN